MRNASRTVALLFLHLLSVVSFAPACTVNVSPGPRSSRRHFDGGFNGAFDNCFEPYTRHGKDRVPPQVQESQMRFSSASRRTLTTNVSPLFSGPSTNSPSAENKGGIIRTVRKLLLFPLVSCHRGQKLALVPNAPCF